MENFPKENIFNCEEYKGKRIFFRPSGSMDSKDFKILIVESVDKIKGEVVVSLEGESDRSQVFSFFEFEAMFTNGSFAKIEE